MLLACRTKASASETPGLGLSSVLRASYQKNDNIIIVGGEGARIVSASSSACASPPLHVPRKFQSIYLHVPTSQKTVPSSFTLVLYFGCIPTLTDVKLHALRLTPNNRRCGLMTLRMAESRTTARRGKRACIHCQRKKLKV